VGPGDRGKLLLHLLEEGRRAVVGQRESLVRDRRDAVAHTSEALPGMYGEGYLSELREDWPAWLAVLRADTNLKLPDCCVLLAAEQTHGAVATFDDRLATAARERGFVVRDR